MSGINRVDVECVECGDDIDATEFEMVCKDCFNKLKDELEEATNTASHRTEINNLNEELESLEEKVKELEAINIDLTLQNEQQAELLAANAKQFHAQATEIALREEKLQSILALFKPLLSILQ